MVGHVGQIILLVVIGGYLARLLGEQRSAPVMQVNRFGISGILLALFTLAVWLLPVSLDRALDQPAWTVAKFLTVPLLLGLPLRFSWPHLPSVVRGALWANAISMAFVMGWLYLEAPIRLCNNYLTNEQELLGYLYLATGSLLCAWWIVRAFFAAPAAARGRAV